MLRGRCQDRRRKCLHGNSGQFPSTLEGGDKGAEGAVLLKHVQDRNHFRSVHVGAWVAQTVN